MATEVIGRARAATHYRDTATGRRWSEFTLHDQNYLAAGVWAPVVEGWLPDTSVAGFTQKSDRHCHRILAGTSANRRWYPRRDSPEYVEASRPQYWDGSRWRSLAVGTIAVSGATVTCDSTNLRIALSVHSLGLTVTLTLKNSSASTRYRWPLAFSGLAYDDATGDLTAGGTWVGRIESPSAHDASGAAVAVTTAWDGANLDWTITPSSVPGGAVYPISVDPDFTAASNACRLQGGGGDYATARVASPGSDGSLYVGSFLSGFTYVDRTWMRFDTSSIPDGDTVSQVNLALAVATNASTTDFDVQIVKVGIDNTTPQTTYNTILSAALDDSIWRSTAGISTNTSSSSGNLSTAYVSRTGYTYYGLVSSRDRANIGPSGDEYVVFHPYNAANATYRPTLTVLHSAAPPPAIDGAFVGSIGLSAHAAGVKVGQGGGTASVAVSSHAGGQKSGFAEGCAVESIGLSAHAAGVKSGLGAFVQSLGIAPKGGRDYHHETFAFVGGHSNTQHYIVWTDDILASAPVWHPIGTGLPARELPGANAHHQWAIDPFAPRDRVYGVEYDQATGNAQALYRCDDIRGTGAFTKLFGLAEIKTWTGNGSLATLTIQEVRTSPYQAAGWLFCVALFDTAAWLMHSHDYGATWTHVTAPFNVMPVGAGVAKNGDLYVLSGSGRDLLYRSGDGGDSWATVYDLTTFKALDDLWVPQVGNDSGLVLYRSAGAATDSGLNSKSTDGGAHWTAWGSLPYTGAYGDLIGPDDDADTFYLYQIYGPRVDRTRDGGATWTEIPSGGTNVTTLYPVDSTTVIAAGGWGMAQPSFDWYIGSYDPDGWRSRDGNLADIFGADYGTARFCFIAGITLTPRAGGFVQSLGVALHGAGEKIAQLREGFAAQSLGVGNHAGGEKVGRGAAVQDARVSLRAAGVKVGIGSAVTAASAGAHGSGQKASAGGAVQSVGTGTSAVGGKVGVGGAVLSVLVDLFGQGVSWRRSNLRGRLYTVFAGSKQTTSVPASKQSTKAADSKRGTEVDQ